MTAARIRAALRGIRSARAAGLPRREIAALEALVDSAKEGAPTMQPVQRLTYIVEARHADLD